MGKSLLVTLADKKYLDSAKQVISSAYFNGSWSGDFMLLANSLAKEELEWFSKKRILIKNCEDFEEKIILKKDPNRIGKWEEWMETAAKKIYLFHGFFKNWDNIVFLDSDVMVRASIRGLSNVNGFLACEDCLNFGDQIYKIDALKPQEDREKYKKLKKIYNFKSPAFNSGVMAFKTNLIKEETFSDLKRYMQEYQLLAYLGDQTILNIYFYKKWKKLPLVFNGYAPFLVGSNLKTITVHTIGYVDNIGKPWEEKCPYHKEWKKNLSMADFLNIKNPFLEENFFSKKEIIYNSERLKLKMIADSIKRSLKEKTNNIKKALKKLNIFNK